MDVKEEAPSEISGLGVDVGVVAVGCRCGSGSGGLWLGGGMLRLQATG